MNIKIKGKGGSMMVEAAIFYPIGILSVIATVYISIFMVMMVYDRSEIHMTLVNEELNRTKKGEICLIENKNIGNVEEYKDFNKYKIKMKNSNAFDCVYEILESESNRRYQLKSIFKERKDINQSYKKYVINEKKYIRMVDVIYEII